MSGTFTDNAAITASGGAGTGGSAGSTGGGGGSGGSIYISAITFAGTSGSFAANGGIGGAVTGNTGGGGGGGKVSVRYVTDSSSFLASRTAAGVAAAAGSAAVGTLYTGSFYDAAGPAMTGAVTADSDNDGQIDQVVVTFDTDVSSGTVAGSDFSVAGYTVSSASRTASATVTIVLAESGAADTNATPTVTIVGVIEDASANVTSSGTQASTDGAAPVRLSQSYKDVVSVNGTVDRFDVVYSENITLDECDSADYVFAGADVGSIVLSSCAVSSTNLQLTVTGAASNDTLLTLTVEYVASGGTANSIHDAANNNSAAYAAQALSDGAAPFALSASYLDTGATPDGNVNRVDIVFTEPMTISYTAGDWAFTTPGSLNLVDGGGSASTATINLIRPLS